jgi:hypothetical protein
MKQIRNITKSSLMKEVMNALVVGTSLCLPPLENGLTRVTRVS